MILYYVLQFIHSKATLIAILNGKVFSKLIQMIPPSSVSMLMMATVYVSEIFIINFIFVSLSIKRFHPYFELLYFRHGKAMWSSKLFMIQKRMFRL